MSDSGLRRLAWGVFGLTTAAFVGNIVRLIQIPPETTSWGYPGAWAEIFFSLAVFTFPLIGALISSQHPRNAIGWILLIIGVVWGLNGLSASYVAYALQHETWTPGPDLVIAVTAWLWVPGVGLPATFLVMLFPNGHLPSPRWTPFAWFSGAVLVLVSVVSTITPGSLDEAGHPELQNPVGIEALRPLIPLLDLAPVLLLICIIGAVAALVQRFRRSVAQERLQLKWLAAAASAVAFAALVAVGASAGTGLAGIDSPAWLKLVQQVELLSFALIPVAMGIAILRHRLYDIDLIINRTLVYLGLTGTLGLAYLATVTVLQAAFRPFAGESNFAIAVSTLVVAGVFRPAHVRIQAFIDRRFYRSKYDAAQTVERFSARLRDEVDLEALTAEMIAVVNETMQPSKVSLWLKEARRTRETSQIVS